MKFDELDKKLRVYESLNDRFMLPGVNMVARLDGRSFTRLTKEVHQFESPFDIRFRDYMVQTVQHLMDCGFRVVFGYTQSDEISLLFHQDENGFSRKLRKLNSVLAGEASAKFSTLLGDVGVIDSRISELPGNKLVVDYFRWRNEDASRNALNAHCYWALRKNGHTVQKATAELSGLSAAEKNELLYRVAKINFNDLPLWQKRGTGVCWESYEKEATNPKTREKVKATRNRLKVDYELPMKDKFTEYVFSLLNEESKE
jgi:tRNA(His) 5'-end guanylyltransferase